MRQKTPRSAGGRIKSFNPLTHEVSSSPFLSGATGRNIGSGALALVALSSAGKSVEALRYGQIGNAMMNVGMAAGAGFAAYHMFNNSAGFKNVVDPSVTWMRSQSLKLANHNAGAGKTLGNVANWISHLAK